MNHDIFLNIDTLILRGLDQVDRRALTEALQQALVDELLLDPALTAVDLSRVRTDITLPAAIDAEQLGQALGQSLGGIISNGEAAAGSDQKTTAGDRRHA